jgi:hypothetical protein
MQYIKTHWIHTEADEPVWIYSELDAHRWEVRKIEVFPDGSCGYADAAESKGSTWLCEIAVPPLSEIDSPGELETVEIDPAEFESIWARRLSAAPHLLGHRTT